MSFVNWVEDYDVQLSIQCRWSQKCKHLSSCLLDCNLHNYITQLSHRDWCHSANWSYWCCCCYDVQLTSAAYQFHLFVSSLNISEIIFYGEMCLITGISLVVTITLFSCSPPSCCVNWHIIFHCCIYSCYTMGICITRCLLVHFCVYLSIHKTQNYCTDFQNYFYSDLTWNVHRGFMAGSHLRS